MSKRKDDGINALVRVSPPPLEEMNLLDWFASMAVMTGRMNGAAQAYDLAEDMMEERNRRYK